MTPRPSRAVHALPVRSTRARKRKAATAVPIALVLALAIGAAVAVLGAGHPAGRPAARPAAAASTRGARWLAGPAGRLLKAVYADLGRFSASARAGQGGVARTVGPRLAADAGAALGGPMPPADDRAYRSALRTLERAGRYAESGEFSKADALLGAGGNDIAKVTAAADHPARVSAPAAVGEPAGQ